jgi:hypothetical protein
MSHQRVVTVHRRVSIGHVAIGLAAVVGVVPASFAQAPRVVGQGKPAGTTIEEEQPMNQGPGSNTRVSVAVPIGRVSAGRDFPNGEPIYVRRTTVRAGMTVVEVSTTPFMPVLPAKEQAAAILRPDQPASW